MSLDTDMKRELEDQKRRNKTITRAIFLYKKLFGKKSLSWEYFENGSVLESFFQQKHQEADKILRSHHNSNEAVQTEHEKSLCNLLRSEGFRAEMITTARLGIFSGDIFIPSIAVCIEVNGWIHEKVAKKNKDDYKELNLQILGIKTWPYPNELVTRHHVIELIRGLRLEKKLKHKEKRKLRRLIYIATIASLNRDEQILLFGDDPSRELFLNYFLNVNPGKMINKTIQRDE